MAESIICLKPVSALLTNGAGAPATYHIPGYQRGYRWSPRQVTQLLDDLWEFFDGIGSRSKEEFYCLQPLVIKPDSDRFEVVDGQQRLTTILLILTYFNQRLMEDERDPLYSLTFATRTGFQEFLTKLSPEDADRNADFFHLYRAMQAIRTWFKDRRSYVSDIESVLLNRTKVIWFELGKNDNAVDAFTRLNVGKIPLTNDELIRALFLGRGRQEETEDESIKVRIAYEWDLIEKELQAADFWAFLTDEKREQNRIGFLFKLIAKANGIPPEAEHDNYKVFYSFSKKLGESTPEKEWLKIKQEFMRLQEWFEDRITYHIVGFLVTQSVDPAEIRQLSQECTKSQFDRRLRDRVYRCVMGVPTVPPEQELRVNLAEYLDGLEYGRDSKKIRSILLLFNIATLLEHKRSNMRFQFDAFKDSDHGWDLEHIRSVSSDRITNQAAWLEDCLRVLETQPDAAAQALVPAINGYIASANIAAAEERFEELHRSILEYFHESDDEEERNDLANLTLLDSRTNRSYKNAPFAVKRQKILSLDKAGIFIPLCTRNAFLKAYSAQPGNSIFWTDEDGEACRQSIHKTLVGFFLGKEAVQ